MKEEESKNLEFTPEMADYVRQLCNKSLVVFEKTKNHANVTMSLGGFSLPIRVDDIKLMYIGAYLLPNIVNYLVNILPQFIYPYIVAYLQDLSSMRDEPITVNELYDFLINFNHGHILDSPEAEN